MKQLLSAYGRGCVRAIISAAVVFGLGLLAAPDLNAIFLLGVAAFVGLIAGGIRAIQAYLTKASLAVWLGEPYGEWADSFIQAFLGSLLVTLTGWLGAPSLAGWRAFATSAIVGAINVAVRALQGALTSGDYPARDTGVREPAKP